MRWLVKTSDDWTLLLLRVVLGAVILPHGLQKTVGLFGGGGYAGTMGWFQSMGIPAPLGFLAIMAESLGAILLISGLLARPAALGILSVMAVAVLTVHAKVGFFMNWEGNVAGEGFEYHLLAMALAVPVIVKGAGAWSVDGVLAKMPRSVAARHVTA